VVVRKLSQHKGSYLWEATTMNRMSKSFALVLSNTLFAHFPSVGLIFSQQIKKHMTKEEMMENMVISNVSLL
jgi:hypothetical protein